MTQDLWNILTKTTDWVKFSDTKAVFILTVYGVIITIVYSNSVAVYNFASSNWVTILLTLLISVSSLISIIYSFLVINPRLKNSNPTSLIYFGHIQEKFKTYQEYYEEVKQKLNSTEILNEQLSEQIHINSIVAWKKFTNVTISIRFFFVTIILLSLNLLIYFLSN